MDGATFDTITRRLAGTNRRDLFTGLTGGLLALVGLGATTRGAAGQRCNDKRESCDRDDDCCRDLICRGGECRADRDNDNNRCADQGERCDRNNDCCDEMECRDRECRGGRNDDNNGCSSRGERCDRTNDCCGDLICRDRECRN
jgi:hypothetical protein